jgi:hypothetical protein
MGKALITTHAFKQAITGGAFESLAAATSDSLSIPNFIQGTNADLVDVWGANSAHACDFGIRSPSFHDNTRGLRMAYGFQPTVGAGDKTQLLIPPAITQPLYPSDTLTVEVNGTNPDNVGLAYTAFYDNLPGADQNLVTAGEVRARVINYVGIKIAVTAGAAGDFGATRLLNADDDRLIANTNYAILGAILQIPACTVVIVAPETSGRRIGLPGHWNEAISSGYFMDLSDRYQRTCVPVVNSNNRGNITLQAASPAGATATALTLVMAELRG